MGIIRSLLSGRARVHELYCKHVGPNELVGNQLQISTTQEGVLMGGASQIACLRVRVALDGLDIRVAGAEQELSLVGKRPPVTT